MKLSVRFLLLVVAFAGAYRVDGSGMVYKKTYHSSAFTLLPGGVHKRNIPLDWPEGHIAVRSFDAEVVDEFNNSVPLSDLYLHHWIVMRALVNGSNIATIDFNSYGDYQFWPNSGTCRNYALAHWFGEGSETRRTNARLPGPYGVETGNPSKVKEGMVERWFTQIHAIDTRDAVDARTCIECRCDAFNATVDSNGGPLPEGYTGGLYCCYEGVRCATNGKQPAVPKSYRLKYTIEYVEYSECVVPVRVYILDVTDNGLPPALGQRNGCQVEYHVEKCDGGNSMGSCVHTYNQSIRFPHSGKVVLGVGHLHAGAMGVTLWGKDDQLICDSIPIYGRGSAPGDEAGYVTGMQECRYEVGHELAIQAGDELKLRSSYSSDREHTGVMGLMFLMVAADDDLPKGQPWHCAWKERMAKRDGCRRTHETLSIILHVVSWFLLTLGIVTVWYAARAAYKRSTEQGYKPLDQVNVAEP